MSDAIHVKLEEDEQNNVFTTINGVRRDATPTEVMLYAILEQQKYTNYMLETLANNLRNY